MKDFRLHFRAKICVVLVLLLIPFSIVPFPTPHAQTSEIDQKRQEIDDLQNKLNDLGSQKVTLVNTIEKISTQIQISEKEIAKTQAEIADLERQIDELSIRIGSLEDSLQSLSQVVVERVNQMYRQKQSSPVSILFQSSGIQDFLSKYQYMKVAQARTLKVMIQSETQKVDYDQQKQAKEIAQKAVEQKKRELEKQKADLATQQHQQQSLLEETKNDEQTFQKKLEQAKAEYESLQAIIAGKGDETEGGDVHQGDRIASILTSGDSLFCNSSGYHLHFTVTDSARNPLNPFDFLKEVESTNLSGTGSCTGDSFNPHGSWEWPLSPKITMSQGYGTTCANSSGVMSQFYSFHNGIDIVGTDTTVKAVQDGKLFRGSYNGSNFKTGAACKLPYVRMEHTDGKNTFYLHVNY